MQFSPEQRSAIDAENRELLVSAAAGSGKTAVLIEKIYTLLSRDGLRIDRMLVVTFTRAAAAEMRERLKQRMGGDAAPHIRRQRDRLELAHISTLHSFCHSLTQEYFQVVDIDPLSAVADTTTASNLMQEATDEAMERLYARAADGDAPAAALCDRFEDKQIVSMTAALYPFLMTLADPFGWLRGHAEKQYTLSDLQTGAMAETLLADCAVLLDGMRELAGELAALAEHPLCHEKYIPSLRADCAAVDALLAAVSGGLLAVVAAVQRFGFDKLPAVRGLSDEEKEINLRYKDLREGIKKLAAKIGGLFPQSPDVAVARLNAMQPALLGLHDLCADLHSRYLDKKKQRAVLDPNDLEHMALAILRRPEIRAAVAARFDAVFVDEYQDISGVQEALLNALKRAPADCPDVSRETIAADQPQAPANTSDASRVLFHNSADSGPAPGVPAHSPAGSADVAAAESPVSGVPNDSPEAVQRQPTAAQPPEAAHTSAASQPGHTAVHASPHAPAADAADAAEAGAQATAAAGADGMPAGGAPNALPPQRFFYVGDVKQSIYRFRQADPTLFMHKEETFSPDANAPQRLIDLNRNYRSRGAVLAAVNRVFERIMRRDVTEIAYSARARLYPGQETENDPPVQLHVFTTPLSSTERTRVQAAAAAREILARVGQPFFDRKENRLRTLRWRDIAILAPRMKGVDEVLTRVLGAAGIPVYAEGSGAGLQSDEITQVLCHLRLMDNIQDDLSLLACLRSPALQLTDEELSAIRIRTPHGSYLEAVRAAAQGDDALAARCARALADLEHERFLLRSMPLPEYLWGWLSRSGLYAFYGCQPYGGLRQANLRLLCEKAVEFQGRGGGDLRAFLQSVVSVTAAKESVSPTVLSPREDVVRVMSVHKSKGLEFPVVFLLGLEAGFEHNGGPELSLHQTLGVALPYIDPVLRVKGATLLSAAIALRQKAETLAERARVLYVGMTRARDELLLLGCAAEPRLSSAPPSAYAVSNARHMLDWLLACADPAVDAVTYTEPPFSTQPTSFPQFSGGFRLVFHNSEEEAVDFLLQAQPQADTESLQKQQSRLEILTGEARAMAQAMPPAATDDPLAPCIPRSYHPFKVGVTALVRARQLPGIEAPALAGAEGDDPGDQETERVKRLPLPLTRPRQIADLPALPAFMREAGEGPRGVQRGVATHKALCLLDYDALRPRLADPAALRLAVEEQLEGFVKRRLMTPQEAALPDAGALAGFFESPWGRGALAAETVHREWGFVLRLPEENDLLVQGVIDLCYLQNGQWELVDYKTDAVKTADALWPLYGAQAALYRRALEEITSYPVRGMTLYSISLGQGSTR